MIQGVCVANGVGVSLGVGVILGVNVDTLMVAVGVAVTLGVIWVGVAVGVGFLDIPLMAQPVNPHTVNTATTPITITIHGDFDLIFCGISVGFSPGSASINLGIVYPANGIAFFMATQSL